MMTSLSHITTQHCIDVNMHNIDVYFIVRGLTDVLCKYYYTTIYLKYNFKLCLHILASRYNSTGFKAV